MATYQRILTENDIGNISINPSYAQWSLDPTEIPMQNSFTDFEDYTDIVTPVDVSLDGTDTYQIESAQDGWYLITLNLFE